jgi:hypothetical protein
MIKVDAVLLVSCPIFELCCHKEGRGGVFMLPDA